MTPCRSVITPSGALRQIPSFSSSSVVHLEENQRKCTTIGPRGEWEVCKVRNKTFNLQAPVTEAAACTIFATLEKKKRTISVMPAKSQTELYRCKLYRKTKEMPYDMCHRSANRRNLKNEKQMLKRPTVPSLPATINSTQM